MSPPPDFHRQLQRKTEELAVSLMHARRTEEALRDETRALELLNRIGRDLSSKLALPEVLQAVTDAGSEICAADFGVFVSSAPARGQGAASGAVNAATRQAFCDALAQRRLAWDRPFHCDDLAQDAALRERLMLSPEHGAGGAPRSLMFIPVVSRSGHVLGALIFGHSAARVFTERTERILGGIAAQAAVAIDNAHLYTQITREMNETRLLSSLQADNLERMRSLSRRLMIAEEHERKVLGRELHDRVGSNLSALLLSVTLLGSELPREAARSVSKRLGDIKLTLQETMEHVRDLLGTLRPTALDELGLVPALRHKAAILTASTGVEFVVNGRELTQRLPPESEMAFFRIAQEALANVLKHANARRVELEVGQKGGVASMRIQDDGCGFDPEARRPGAASLGLTIMRERAEAIGAVLQVDSQPGSGARVEVALLRGPPPQPGPA